jgi:hypothetical protein
LTFYYICDIHFFSCRFVAAGESRIVSVGEQHYKTLWDAGCERGFSPIAGSGSSGFNRSQSMVKLGYE